MESPTAASETSVQKKAYVTPWLVEYGNLEKLTQGGNGNGADAGGGGPMTMGGTCL